MTTLYISHEPHDTASIHVFQSRSDIGSGWGSPIEVPADAEQAYDSLLGQCGLHPHNLAWAIHAYDAVRRHLGLAAESLAEGEWGCYSFSDLDRAAELDYHDLIRAVREVFGEVAGDEQQNKLFWVCPSLCGITDAASAESEIATYPEHAEEIRYCVRLAR